MFLQSTLPKNIDFLCKISNQQVIVKFQEFATKYSRLLPITITYYMLKLLEDFPFQPEFLT